MHESPTLHLHHVSAALMLSPAVPINLGEMRNKASRYVSARMAALERIAFSSHWRTRIVA